MTDQQRHRHRDHQQARQRRAAAQACGQRGDGNAQRGQPRRACQQPQFDQPQRLPINPQQRRRRTSGDSGCSAEGAVCDVEAELLARVEELRDAEGQRYRAGMAERAVERAPVCTPRRGGSVLIFDAAIPADALPPLPWDYGLTAVIEEEGGIKSYWAMAHPPEKPDFHDPACFAATLAAPEAP